MSTRSGKRIHGSTHENFAKPDIDIVVLSERKTRSRRLKDNCDEVIVPKSKKRHNYVSYPTDDEQIDNSTKVPENIELVTKSSKKTLKEKDLNVSVKTVDEIDSGRVIRHTRRTKKYSENIPDEIAVEIPVVEIENIKSKKKNKKNKKKKTDTKVDIVNNEDVAVVPKKSKKKKCKSSHTATKSSEVSIEHFNKSNGSIDSFHSAAGSPINVQSECVNLNGSFGKSPRRAVKRLKADSCEDDNADQTQNEIFAKNSKKIKLSNFDDKLNLNNRSLRSDDESDKRKGDTFDKSQELAEVLNTTLQKDAKRKRKSSIKNDLDQVLNCTEEKVNTPNKFNKSNEHNTRRKSLRSTYDKTDTPPKVEQLNSTYEKNNTSTEMDKIFEGDVSRRKSLRSTFDKSDTRLEKMNSTFEMKKTSSESIHVIGNKVHRKSLQSTFDTMDPPSKKANGLNSTFEKGCTPKKNNTTLEEVKIRRMSLRLSMSGDKLTEKVSLNTTFENPKGSMNSLNKIDNSKLNSTFDKSKDSRPSTINTTFEKSQDSKQSTLNSTFDKETKLNSTFDKPQNQSDSESKSSLISSDNASNVTFDKSDEISRISITSDDSRTENIVNTTPVLIESSMDESQVREPSPRNMSQASDETNKASVTPLKREGTFTKDGPDVVSMSPKSNTSLNKTPVKRMSLPSPGSTPFPFSKSSQKEKCMLNVTRSIEKSLRRSSLVEAAPRQTRVMFCSPVNNPAVVMQQKRKVIKSNLKGSNKSFIFDESVSEQARPAPRKRSYTQNDADDARAKRKRLADDQLQSVARLSRPRTSSATVKQSEPSTPSKKPLTPHKTLPLSTKSEAKLSRTKLPNFAALHQKQFAKMESLDECQVRKARRAKQLLTPTGALAIIEKSSPKGRATTTAESTKPEKEVTKKTDPEVKRTESEVKKTDTEIKKTASKIKKTDFEAKKTDSEVRQTDTEVPKSVAEVTLMKKPVTPSKAPKGLTLDSLRPGYTRFGFKMNLDVNPFSIPPKTDTKPKVTKPNGFLTRQPSQPSLAGATTGRREVAKQIVMRERSFTSLSDKRNEKRTTIKGVRTNRRFELQMKLRNINA